MTDNPTILTDEAFIEQFEKLTLDPVHFNHQGHLRLAFLYLKRYSLDEAINKTCTGIKAYAESLGVKDKFHMTITHALVKIIEKRLQQTEKRSWEDFLNNNMDLVTDARGVLGKYFSSDILESEIAKNNIVDANLCSL